MWTFPRRVDGAGSGRNLNAPDVSRQVALRVGATLAVAHAGKPQGAESDNKGRREGVPYASLTRSARLSSV